MSNDDLTSRRIEGKWRQFLDEFSSIYQKRAAPKPGFWPAWDAEESIIIEKLKRRPIALAEIETVFSMFRAKMLKAL